MDDNNNLAFFVPFSDAATQGKQGLWRSHRILLYLTDSLLILIKIGGKGSNIGAMVVRVLLVLLATTMNESAVDSLQNAIVATLSSTFFVDK